MMKSLIFTLVACALLSTLPQAALAGGDNGGSKNQKGTIRVRNNSDVVVAAIVDNEDPPVDEDEFLDAGGKILQPGQTARFRVASGDHTLTLAALDDEGEIIDDDTVDVDVESRKTLTVGVDVVDDLLEIDM